ncbi:MAG: helix-turn-helix transcriptional regulator [Brevundimonas sp.]|uniref:helix-turn-helix transcriptional regulator n=1 Tax=Brevundimonas sp. TaxID=1871086 RepID=UPI004034DE9C
MTLGDTSVLERLNAAERDVLVLLAQGHTAKSIAVLREVSVAAVNERLRSARRKTGVGSSRELARLVSAQESRDDLIGLAAAPPTDPASIRPDATPSRQTLHPGRWSIVMIVAASLAAAALFAQQTASVSMPNGQSPSVVSDLLSHQQRVPDMAALHAEAAGAPDPSWSTATEAAISDRYNAVLEAADGVESFKVTCSATVCEAAGATRLDVAGAQVADLLARLQDVAAGTEQLPGLDHVYGSYGSNPARSGSFVFVTYWRRA